MPSSLWILVFFIGWPLSGGNGATTTKFSRPTLSPGRDGRLTKEGIRDTEDIHREFVDEAEDGKHLADIVEQLEEANEGSEISENVSYEDHNTLEDKTLEASTNCEEGQAPGVVQEMVRKFSSHGSRQTPFLIRRNTVARCTNVMKDIKGRKHNLIQHNVEGQHIIWVDSVTGADAATDLEFSSLMERISGLNSALNEKTKGGKDQNCVSKENSTTLYRNSSSRKSLPACALKSYMRGTKASVMKTRDGNTPHCLEGDKCTLNRHLPSPQSSLSPSGISNKRIPLLDASTHSQVAFSCRSKNINSHLEGGETMRRKRLVNIKPSIPPVLLKGANKTVSEKSSNSTTEVSHKHKGMTSQTVIGVRETLSTSYDSECDNGDKAELFSQHHLLSGQCDGKCSHCLLVDLWFTIWHVEFNKK